MDRPVNNGGPTMFLFTCFLTLLLSQISIVFLPFVSNFVSNFIICLKFCHLSQILSFVSNFVVCLKFCHLSQILSFVSNFVSVDNAFTTMWINATRYSGEHLVTVRLYVG